jgi:hypothetical protein
MSSSSSDLLDEFYAAVQSPITVGEIKILYAAVIEYVHANGLTNDMRLARGRVKSLCDEIAPMIHFLRSHATDSESVQFPLNDGPIDCTVFHRDGSKRQVQITGAQRRARLNIMTELNRTPKKIGRGYIGVTDDRPTTEFRRAMAKERVMYTTGGAQQTLRSAIFLCLERKSDAKGADTLLIDAPLNVLPTARFEEILPTLVDVAAGSVFHEVFLVGNGECINRCYKLK